jgi:hypothetical protein
MAEIVEAFTRIDRAVEDFRSSVEEIRDSAGEGDFRRLRDRLSSDLAMILLSGPARLEMDKWLWGMKTWSEPLYPEAEWESCPICDRNGMEDCPDCEGDGVILDSGDPDEKTLDCFYCGGTGRAECSECDGLGEVQNDGPPLEALAVWQEKAAAGALTLIEDRPKVLSRTGVDHG